MIALKLIAGTLKILRMRRQLFVRRSLGTLLEDRSLGT